jgi:hypothetical protein
MIGAASKSERTTIFVVRCSSECESRTISAVTKSTVSEWFVHHSGLPGSRVMPAGRQTPN